jgi:hypothetical protein
MADYKNLVPFILKAEGGLSGIRADSASKNPSNCGRDKKGNPYHTNKGITWSTFQSFSKTAGYEASCSNFLSMPEDVWGKIYKIGFWDKVEGDRIKNQAVANILAEISWMSGMGSFDGKKGLKPFLRTFFKNNYNVDFTDFSKMVDFINDLENKGQTPQLFKNITSFRKDKYISMNQPTFLKGWLSRLNAFIHLNTPYVDSIRFKANENFRNLPTITLIMQLDAVSPESFNEFVDDDVKIRYFIGKYGDIFVKYSKGTNLFFNSLLTMAMSDSSFGNSLNVKNNNNFFVNYVSTEKYPSAEEGIKAFVTNLTSKYKKAIDISKTPGKQIINITLNYKKGLSGQNYLNNVQDILDSVRKLFTFGKIS